MACDFFSPPSLWLPVPLGLIASPKAWCIDFSLLGTRHGFPWGWTESSACAVRLTVSGPSSSRFFPPRGGKKRDQAWLRITQSIRLLPGLERAFACLLSGTGLVLIGSKGFPAI